MICPFLTCSVRQVHVRWIIRETLPWRDDRSNRLISFGVMDLCGLARYVQLALHRYRASQFVGHSYE